MKSKLQALALVLLSAQAPAVITPDQITRVASITGRGGKSDFLLSGEGF